MGGALCTPHTIMADEFTWNLSEIRTQFLSLIGDSTLAEATANKWINSYYQDHFPEDSDVDELKDWYEQSTSATDSGEYDLEQTDLKILEPVTRNGTEIRFIHDPKKFFRRYPKDEQYITAPTLAIGVSDTKKVKHSDFIYKISEYSYSKSSSEISLSGLSVIPQSKYGAFAFQIDADGTITVTEATLNSTGYATPTKAIEDLPYSDSDSAYMGFVTVINTSDDFTPATTELSGVTATYTDGMPEKRMQPEAVTIYQNKLYARPKANDIFLLEAPELIRPSALSGDDSIPADKKWGPAIALGTAILYLIEVVKLSEEDKRVQDLRSAFDYRISSIRKKWIFQNTERVIERAF